VCSIVRGELIYGAHKSVNPVKKLWVVQSFLGLFASLAFDDSAADEYGRIRHILASQGKIIGPNDLMIAAIALANNLTLVTHNTAEFGRVPGLKFEDWQA
jgi:tRNA(fMet)-specific endonuclease VapC